jgi:MarC family membrane protein
LRHDTQLKRETDNSSQEFETFEPLMTVYSAAILLFLVMDPLGNVPVFLSILKDVPPLRRKPIIIRELLIALGVLLLFLVLGRFILDVLQINGPSLSIAGGIVLFLIALRMIFPSQEGLFGYSMEREPFIVPLAIPLIAGPSAMACVLLMVTREPDRLLTWGMALLCAWLVTAVILVSSSYLSRWLGPRGLTALERLMGMILTAISVQMFLNGFKQFLAG